MIRGLPIGTAALGSQTVEAKPGNRSLLFIPTQEETGVQKVPIACLALGRKPGLGPRVIFWFTLVWRICHFTEGQDHKPGPS